jgi:hypothetical protein
MNGIMRLKLRKKTGFGQSLHNFTQGAIGGFVAVVVPAGKGDRL